MVPGGGGGGFVQKADCQVQNAKTQNKTAGATTGVNSLSLALSGHLKKLTPYNRDLLVPSW